MQINNKPLNHAEKDYYNSVDLPHELSREEKDELLFALLDHLNMRVYRATFDAAYTVLTPKE